MTKNNYSKFRFKFNRYIARLPLKFYPIKDSKLQFSTGSDGVDITKLREYKDADIIHLHWINGLVKLSSLSNVNKPIIWTIRDMWPITGGCHVALSEDSFCDKYKVGCGRCPILHSNDNSDLSRSTYLKKYNLFRLKSLDIIGISHWITKLASTSEIFKSAKFQHIPNNIDTSLFKPIDRDVARKGLNIIVDEGCKVISIGAHDLLMRHKGFYEFSEALKYLDKSKILFLFFGFIDNLELEKLKINYLSFGYISDNYFLRNIYCSSDLFLATSLIESFGKTLAEALSCQIPVVCFDSTGTADIVKHKITGYKAKSYDPKDLANGIKWLFRLSKVKQLEIAHNSRKWVLATYDSIVIAKQYDELYKNRILNAD